MIDVLERTPVGEPTPWRPSIYYATAADARTQVAASWQIAAEMAQTNPALAGDAQRLQLLEALTHLLDALAYLDVEVEQPARQLSGADQAERCWSTYADTVTYTRTAAQAAEALVAAPPAPTLGTSRLARLQRSISQLGRHIDALGSVIAARQACLA
jgi:hypothetical protein